MNRSEKYCDCNFVELLILALDGHINEEQFDYLQKQISTNDEAHKLYCDFMATYVGLSQSGRFASSRLNRPEPKSGHDVLLAMTGR